MDALKRAIAIAGGDSALAQKIGVSGQFIGQVLRGQRPLPPKRCAQIEEATAGQVTREELRPDIFGRRPAVPLGNDRPAEARSA